MNIHEIKDIVKNRQSEAVIKQWIDNNMGFWSVAYEKFFNDEYIAVGQYNFSSGPCDYLILCSRSKMKVIVIEIKGAEFPFINNSGSVNAEINYAHQQVRQRFNDIQSSCSDFRIKIHDYRQNILTSALTPKTYKIGNGGLEQVDPCKDIIFTGMVIGGYNNGNDRLESSIKNQMQIGSNPYIRFESWNSLLNKIALP